MVLVFQCQCSLVKLTKAVMTIIVSCWSTATELHGIQCNVHLCQVDIILIIYQWPYLCIICWHSQLLGATDVWYSHIFIFCYYCLRKISYGNSILLFWLQELFCNQMVLNPVCILWLSIATLPVYLLYHIIYIFTIASVAPDYNIYSLK